MIKTVNIKSSTGYTVINESDFNDKDHKLASDAEVKAADKKALAAAKKTEKAE